MALTTGGFARYEGRYAGTMEPFPTKQALQT